MEPYSYLLRYFYVYSLYCLILYHYTINNDCRWYSICSTWRLDITVSTCWSLNLMPTKQLVNILSARNNDTRVLSIGFILFH